MKKNLLLLLSTPLFVASTAFRPPAAWKSLLDKDLSQWQTYQSYRHQPGYKGQPVVDAQGRPVPPLGYGKNEANVFSVTVQQGEPVLRISGEVYGCVFTKQDYANYDLKLQVKWGTQKWPPRLDEPRDSGVLYNSQGECGVDYWRSWMLGQEFQVSEHQKGNAMGDYWAIANSTAEIRATTAQDTVRYSPAAPLVRVGSGGRQYCQARLLASPAARRREWTELELICVNGQSVHLVNGQVVLAATNAAVVVNGQRQPLTHGKIQLQSEAAEVFYKDIQIRPLAAMPAQYAQYFK